MGRAASIAIALLGLGGAAALVASARIPPRPGPSGDAERVGAEVAGRLREAAAGAQSRAQTLAELPRLAVAVATDAPTVRDLTQEELAFRPRPNETIEIAQFPRDGGAGTSLLRIPEDAKVDLPLERPGIHVVIIDGAVRVASVVKIEPRERADEVYGVVGVSWLADLAPVMAQLAAIGARLETQEGGAVTVGSSPLAGKDNRVVILDPKAAPNARLIVAAPQMIPGGWSAPMLGGAAACAVIGLLLAALVWPRRPSALTGVGLPEVAQFRSTARTDVEGGVRIGRYTVLRRLGSGGMAEVYLARAEGEAGFERLVALKVMHDDMVADANFVSHFLDEAKLASRLSHPNIIAITDLGKEGDKYVIAMEYIDGADLERLVHAASSRGVQVPLRVAFAIARRICDGLHFAHTAVDAQGAALAVVHRDIKGANVFVSRTGAVKIGDFGIAKAADSVRTAKTEIGQVKGTAAYMAPEQRLGRDVDQRADVYSVGAVCYELFTGTVINLDLAMLAHLGKVGWPHLPPPSQVRPELPPELDDVVFRAMAFDREDRYTSCEALEQALAEIADRHGLGATDKVIAQWIAEEMAALPPAARAPTRGRGEARPSP